MNNYVKRGYDKVMGINSLTIMAMKTFTGLEAQGSWPREKGAVAFGLTPQALRHYFLRRCPLDAYRSDRP